MTDGFISKKTMRNKEYLHYLKEIDEKLKTIVSLCIHPDEISRDLVKLRVKVRMLMHKCKRLEKENDKSSLTK